MIRVFVSSTFRDLEIERKLLLDKLNNALTGVGMESFVPNGSTSQEIAIKELKNCDIVIFLISAYYGSFITECKINDCKYRKKEKDCEISYTHCEYKIALAENKSHQIYLIAKSWDIIKEIKDWNEIESSKIKSPIFDGIGNEEIKHYFKVAKKSWEFKEEAEKEFCKRIKGIEDIQIITDQLANNIVRWYSEGKINLQNFCGRRKELKDLIEKMDRSVEVYGVGGIGKTTLVQVALLIKSLQGKKIVTIGTKQSYITDSGYKYFIEKHIEGQHEIIGNKITLDDVINALSVPNEIRAKKRNEKISIVSDKIEKENIILFIDDFHLADDDVKELIKHTSGNLVVASKRKVGIARTELHLIGIDAIERKKLIYLIASRLDKQITDEAMEIIKEIAEGHPVSTEVLIRNYDIINFEKLEKYKQGLDFSDTKHVEEFLKRVVEEILSKEALNLLINLSILNTELENNLDVEAIKRTYPANFNKIFGELISTGFLEKKRGKEGVYQFSYRHIQDAIIDDGEKRHEKAVEYYKNKIKNITGVEAVEIPMESDDAVEILFHLSKSSNDKKLIEVFLELTKKLKAVHLKRLIEIGEQLDSWHEDEDKALILATLGILYWKSRKFEGAENAFNKALGIRKILAENNTEIYLPKLANIQNNLGVLYTEIRKFEDAKKAFNTALKIRKELAENNDIYLPEVAATQDNLGTLYSDLKKFEEAEKAYNEALKIRKKLATNSYDYLGDLAVTQNNLGSFYWKLKRFKDAEKAFNEALIIRKEQAFRNPDVYLPDLAATQNNIGVLYWELKRFGDADKAYNEVLKICKELAEKNPDVYLPRVADAQDNIGILYNDLKKFGDAEKAFNEVLKIRKELIKKNPDVYMHDLIKTVANIGTLYIDANRIEEGIDNLKNALKRRELLPDFGANCFVGLGSGYEKLQNPKDAAQNYFFASANHFLLFKKGVNCLDQVLICLQKVVMIGDGEIKGDAEIIFNVIQKLSGKVVNIPQVSNSTRGEALKLALNGKRVELNVENEIDIMVQYLIEDILRDLFPGSS